MLEQLNSLPMFLIAGGAVAFVIFLCVVFIVRSWRAGVAMGIDKAKLRPGRHLKRHLYGAACGVHSSGRHRAQRQPGHSAAVAAPFGGGRFALRGQRRRHSRTRSGHGGRPWQHGPYGADVCHHRLCDDSRHPFGVYLVRVLPEGLYEKAAKAQARRTRRRGAGRKKAQLRRRDVHGHVHRPCQHLYRLLPWHMDQHRGFSAPCGGLCGGACHGGV